MTRIYIILLSISVIVGISWGSVEMDEDLYRALKMALKSIFRIIVKTIRRKGKASIDPIRVQRDEDFAAMSVDLKKELVDQKALQATLELKERLSQHYAGRVERIYLYGSRVRGDYEPSSDVDVAIFVRFPPNDYRAIKQNLIWYTHELLVKYGFYIQPRVYNSQILHEHEREYHSDYLIQAAVSYGILL